jgi:hypothetical protein
VEEAVNPDKDMRIVFWFCTAIVLLSAAITFWAIMTIKEPPRNLSPKPSKLSREYVSDRKCVCGHFVIVCLTPGCSCEALKESVRG